MYVLLVRIDKQKITTQIFQKGIPKEVYFILKRATLPYSMCAFTELKIQRGFANYRVIGHLGLYVVIIK